MEKFQEKINYRFRDARLLETALTHPSYGGDHHVPHYQRLEFLGDAVLEMVISERLYAALPTVDEGRMTRIRADLVREEALFDIAKALDLGRVIRLSVGEERSGGRDKPSILADVLEAVLAAVYLDGGLDAAKRLILSLFRDRLEFKHLGDHLDAKSRLQEIMQQNGDMPRYDYESVDGPPHAPVFHYSVCAGERILGKGSGNSKQAAQQEAARDALARMGALETICD